MMIFALGAISIGLVLIGTALSDTPDPRAYVKQLMEKNAR